MFQLLKAKFPHKIDKPIESFSGKAILLAKPYLEEAKANPGIMALLANLEGLAYVAELSEGFQKGFEGWFEDVKRIESRKEAENL
uniref:Uncharacterized protein n=1 Tax=viral metagenome TaxID=1070528 RepID=A0A6H2A1Q7_9ZZZZ